MSQIIHIIFYIYTAMLFIRIISSWIPPLAEHQLMGIVSKCTDPYLNLFRRLIPPLGGVLDFSPILGFLVLQLAEGFLRSMFR